MSAVLRYVAPAGAPIRPQDLVRWAGRLVRTGDPRASLRRQLSATVGVEHCFLTSTGRAGLTVILQALRDLASPDRSEVILPSYTCFSVAASIVKAGLTPRIVDIRPETLDYDPRSLEKADTGRVLAVIATNLYGTPNNMSALAAFARSRDVRLVDDAAQAFGAHVEGRLSGMWGDVGLYSFDKGKNVSAIDGGAIVTSSSEVAHAIERRVAALPRSSAADGAHAMLKLAAYATLLRPSLYWIPNSIPQLGLGTTSYMNDFPLQTMGRSLAALAATMVPRSGAFLSARAERADSLRSRLEGRSGLTFVRCPSTAVRAHLRLPVLAADRASKARLIEALNRAGIGASGSYPSCIADIPALRGRVAGAGDCDGGRETAERILTLPTHPLVTPGDIERIVATVERVLGAAGAVLCAVVARTEAR